MLKNLINGGFAQNILALLRILAREKFDSYFNVNYLESHNYMPICCALLKYGYSNFSLEIIEYCKVDKLIEREKDFIKLLSPEYNIVQDPTQNPMSGRNHSDETRQKMSDAQKAMDRTGENHPKSQKIVVTDLETKEPPKTFDSISAASRALNINQSSIVYYFSNNQQKPYKGRYTFTKVIIL
jgi:hypothetical protein